MTKKPNELVDLYYDVEAAAQERRKQGEFDANSKHMIFLLESLQELIAILIERDKK